MEQLPSAKDLFEHAACALLLTDPDGTIRAANATFCRWLGYPPDDLIGKLRVQQLFTMGGRIFHHTHWSPLLQLQGSVAEVQMGMVHRDGRVLPTLINVVRRRHGSEMYDELAIFMATDRQKYERELLLAQQKAEASLEELRIVQKQLRESQDMLSFAMRGALMGVWSLNFSGNRCWWLSRELEELLDIPENGFSGTEEAFRELLHEDDRAVVYDAIEKAVSSASEYLIEFRFQHADGHWRPMEARGRATYDAQGIPLTLIGVVTDITERRAAELQLRQLNNQLSIADRRKDEFLATLAHELRNPLAPMRNVLELLKLKDLQDAQLRWARDVFDRQVQQMTHLIDDLLEVSRITQGRVVLRKQAVDIIEVIQSAIDTTRATIEEAGHHFSLTLPNEPLILNADATRLMQVVCNLLTNAVKYTPKGGHIHLHLERQENRVELSVRDTGIGIEKTELSRVFEMFSQLTPALERSQGGLGIGLALVRGLVELHGGTIHAESAGINRGSVFIVRLPLTPPQLLPTPATGFGLSVSVRKRRVLVVDDNRDAAQSLALALDMLGYITSAAHCGLDGLRLAEEFCPDVMLLDIGLPDVNGYEVARRLREAPWGQHISLVAVTGWGQNDDKNAAKEAGFDWHLTKPVDFPELSSILEA